MWNRVFWLLSLALAAEDVPVGIVSGYTGGFVTAVWVGKDNNKPMSRVTGGGAPAGIWRDYMTAALPRLKVQPIPGGQPPPPPIEETDEDGNPIGKIIEGVTDFFRGDKAEPER